MTLEPRNATTTNDRPGVTPGDADHEAFWRRTLSGFTVPTALWLDRRPHAIGGGGRETRSTPWPGGAPASQSERSTLLVAAWAFLLTRLTGEGDVLFGVERGRRSRREDRTVGVLPLRVTLPAAGPAGNWVAAVDRLLDDVEAHAAVTPEVLREAASVAPSLPLFESVVSGSGEVESAAPLAAAAPANGHGQLTISYDPERFSAWAIERLAQHLGRVIEAFSTHPEAQLESLSLLDDAERRLVIEGWNATSVAYHNQACIHGLFALQVAARPEAIAVVAGAQSLTYRALDERSNRLARRLLALGIHADTCVGIFLERSLDTAIALLGILKAGGAYLPLEPIYPRERLAFMLRDAEVPVVVTQRSFRGLLPEFAGEVLVLDDEAERETLGRLDAGVVSAEVEAQSLAYVTYTSGSTGTPKGAEITHRAVNRLVCAVDYIELGPGHTLLHAAPLAFDASTLEIWGALLTGGRVVMHPEEIPTARGLKEVIRAHGVTTMWLTAALFNAVVDEDPQALSGLKQLLTGGEALSVAHVRRALAALPGTQLFNGYGPTESTTFTTVHPIPRDLAGDVRAIPIGRPIRDTTLYVLDAQRAPVPVGVAGELYIGGAGLARGYLKRPDLTAERFVPNPFGAAGERLYRTGDLVRYLPDGTVDFIGRADTQVKIRGFRIELGEIDATLAKHPDIEKVAVVAREDTPGAKRLVAYIVARSGREEPTTTALRAFIEATLPEYMVPSAFVFMKALPVTQNGKLDQRALPAPGRERPHLQEAFMAPHTERERLLCSAFAAVLEMDAVGVRDNFFELGGSSLLALRLLSQLRQEHKLDVPAVKFFQFPTPELLARWIEGGDGSTALKRRVEVLTRKGDGQGGGHEAVAIVGMAGRFPGAASVEALWKNLIEGVDSITHFREDELDPSLDPEETRDPQYVRARGILEGVELFDAAFFGINPKEAELMDPQQRLFLEVAWEALERAGYCAQSYDGSIGVFGGMYNATYFLRHVQTRPDLIRKVGEFQTMVANEKDYIATRVAHKLGLNGPALSIHTACSTSLVAICQAFESLRSRQCDMALAGGVAVTAPPRSGYLYQEGAMLSPDGCTRTFDANAQGTVFSDGVAIVVLKRLADAQRDGDTIWGVLRGAALTNDGGDRASFTAPSVQGQSAVVAMAHAAAGIDPRTISYVETHGTATPLGDPIEVEALTQAFRLSTPDVGFCGIGSLKSNVGHLVIAAGASGLIKTALMLTHRTIVPSVHFERPNPKLELERSPFYVTDKLMPWPEGATPRRAGVSAFGVGGTNAHVIVEEPPVSEPSAPSRSRELLVLSARSEAALDAATANLRDSLRAHPELTLGDVAFTLQTGRKAFAQRRAIVAGDVADALAAIECKDPKSVFTRKVDSQKPGLAFMFPGQGAQYINMGRTLYRDETKFREAFDECVAAMTPILGQDLRELLFVDADEAAAAETLKATSITQPALFAVEYGLARLFLHLGLTPDAMIGHSVGEFVCAALAGVMTPADAARLVAHRGRLMQAQPSGTMLSVRLAADEVAPRLTPELAVASENGPKLCVVAGPHAAVEALRVRLEADGIVCRPLHTSHAFHSAMMDPAVEPFEKLVRAVRLQAPHIPFVSTVTGTWITPEQAQDARYWAHHLRETVRFATGVRELVRDKTRILLEVGPRATLATLARQQATPKQGLTAISSLSDTAVNETERAAFLAAIGQLWLSGLSIDWPALHEHGPRRRVVLPTYPFERKRFWIDPVRSQPAVPAQAVHQQASVPACVAPAAAPILSPTITAPALVDRPNEGTNAMTQATTSNSRRERLTQQLADLIEEVAGVSPADADAQATFMELGLDSLTLTQAAQQIQKSFNVKVTFRQMMEDCSTMETLVAHLDRELPPDAAPAPVVAAPATPAAPPAAVAAAPAAAALPALSSAPRLATSVASGTLQYVIDQQLALMQQQLALLSGSGVLPAAPAAQLVQNVSEPVATAAPAPAAAPQPAVQAQAAAPVAAEEEPKKPFGAGVRIQLHKTEELTPTQRARLDAFIRRYTARTKGSKAYTQQHRAHLADPRAVTGFRPLMKELVYPVVTERSAGSKLWDVDGNEYVDVLCGFGSNYFGWQPPFVVEAVKKQIDSGYQIGPQHLLSGEVAKLFCDFTGHDRAAFCNTGSEAVMGCMRIARTVTNRNLIAMFTGDYHGIFDEVIVRGTKKLKAVPAAPGILPNTSQNVLVLDYGTPETLEILRSRASELAAILVEPVQSRRPDFQPREFLHDVRRLCDESGTVLIFDEVVCGFRLHPRGAQGYFDIQADLASYGKVIGGGYPIGVIAGKRQYMDALDGGHWQYGDDSAPTVGVTYFAGTFVRHPLALTAAKAVLEHLQEAGPGMQESLAKRAEAFVDDLNQHFHDVGAPIKIKRCTSFWKPFYTEDQAHGDLLFLHLRDRGVHILDGFPCFFTTAHSDQDIAFVAKAFKDAVAELQESGFLPGSSKRAPSAIDKDQPPVQDARLGRDRDGTPAWFVPNPERPGQYVRFEAKN